MAVNRRTLLIAAGAGLAVGWAVWPRRAGVEWAAGKGETVLNAFLKIGSDGRVTVAVPQAEMGQGVWSGLAQLAADELGADWRTVSVEPAPLGPDYANHAAFDGQTAELPGMIRGIAEWAADTVVEFLDFQITGGSTSVIGFEAPLRNAGAAAREMLCKAAARRWDVDWQDCDTRGGFVVHQAQRLRFAEVADDVKASDAPRTPTLRDKPVLRGKPLLRIDIPSKTDGSARFGVDIRLPGMAYVAIEQGPIGATRKSIDQSALPAGAALVEGPDFVAVVANGWFAAKTALEAVKIDYTLPENPPGPWLEAAVKAALDGDGDAVREAGDVAAAAGPGAITADYTLPFLAHACLEPMTATARISDGRCEVWVPTQSATLTTWAVAKALGLDDAEVTIYPTLLGGGFGRKVESDAAVQAALIAQKVGKPVQLIWSREQDMAHDMYRPAVAARMRGAATPAGISAWDAHVAVPDVNAGFMARNLPVGGGGPKTSAGAIEGSVALPYALPNIRVAHSLAECNVPLGFWRSVGNSFSGFIVESFVDELAHAAGADPGAFRLALLKDSPRHAAVLRAALKAGGPLGTVSPGVGRGVALVESFGSIVAEVAEVELVESAAPKVRQVWAAVDCGRVVNPDTVRAQIEGGIIFGLSAALQGRITFAEGRAQQQNFDAYPLLSMAESPAISVTIIASEADPGGIGEPGTPPIAPAVANAIYAAGGGRLRDLPLVRA